mmetsp:Transcript_10097/g.17849  ORF Transcript_10097/g.17849 Transcript_10097/m.17849 type:complete len:1368 (-) Transcript_10097:1200-5303(-)
MDARENTSIEITVKAGLRALWAWADSDGSGQLEGDERIKFARRLGLKQLSWLDENNDGLMSFEEYIGMLDSMPPSECAHVFVVASLLGCLQQDLGNLGPSDIQQLFDFFSYDGLQVHATEFKAFAHGVSEEFMKTIPSFGDLTFEMFRQLLARDDASSGTIEGVLNTGLRLLFAWIDLDENSRLDAKERKNFMVKLGLQSISWEDQDSDGHMNFKEFRAMVNQMAPSECTNILLMACLLGSLQCSKAAKPANMESVLKLFDLFRFYGDERKGVPAASFRKFARSTSLRVSPMLPQGPEWSFEDFYQVLYPDVPFPIGETTELSPTSAAASPAAVTSGSAHVQVHQPMDLTPFVALIPKLCKQQIKDLKYFVLGQEQCMSKTYPATWAVEFLKPFLNICECEQYQVWILMMRCLLEDIAPAVEDDITFLRQQLLEKDREIAAMQEACAEFDKEGTITIEIVTDLKEQVNYYEQCIAALKVQCDKSQWMEEQLMQQEKHIDQLERAVGTDAGAKATIAALKEELRIRDQKLSAFTSQGSMEAEMMAMGDTCRDLDRQNEKHMETVQHLAKQLMEKDRLIDMLESTRLAADESNARLTQALGEKEAKIEEFQWILRQQGPTSQSPATYMTDNSEEARPAEQQQIAGAEATATQDTAVNVQLVVRLQAEVTQKERMIKQLQDQLDKQLAAGVLTARLKEALGKKEQQIEVLERCCHELEAKMDLLSHQLQAMQDQPATQQSSAATPAATYEQVTNIDKHVSTDLVTEPEAILQANLLDKNQKIADMESQLVVQAEMNKTVVALQQAVAERDARILGLEALMDEVAEKDRRLHELHVQSQNAAVTQVIADERIAFLKHDLQGKAQQIHELEHKLEEATSAYEFSTGLDVERVLQLEKEIECRDKKISELERKQSALEAARSDEVAAETSPGVDAESHACILAELEYKKKRIAELEDERAQATAPQAAISPRVEQAARFQTELQKKEQQIAEIERAIQTQSTEDVTSLREVVVKTYRRIQAIHSDEGTRSAAQQKEVDRELTQLRAELADKSQKVRTFEHADARLQEQLRSAHAEYHQLIAQLQDPAPGPMQGSSEELLAELVRERQRGDALQERLLQLEAVGEGGLHTQLTKAQAECHVLRDLLQETEAKVQAANLELLVQTSRSKYCEEQVLVLMRRMAEMDARQNFERSCNSSTGQPTCSAGAWDYEYTPSQRSGLEVPGSTASRSRSPSVVLAHNCCLKGCDLCGRLSRAGSLVSSPAGKGDLSGSTPGGGYNSPPAAQSPAPSPNLRPTIYADVIPIPYPQTVTDPGPDLGISVPLPDVVASDTTQVGATGNPAAAAAADPSTESNAVLGPTLDPDPTSDMPALPSTD